MVTGISRFWMLNVVHPFWIGKYSNKCSDRQMMDTLVVQIGELLDGLHGHWHFKILRLNMNLELVKWDTNAPSV